MNKITKHIYKVSVILGLVFAVAAFYFIPNNLENRFGMPFWVYDIVASHLFLYITMFLSAIAWLLAATKSYAEKRWVIYTLFMVLLLVIVIATCILLVLSGSPYF